MQKVVRKFLGLNLIVKVLIFFLIIILFFLIGKFLFSDNEKLNLSNSLNKEVSKTNEGTNSDATKIYIFVDVSGAVKKPDVYKVIDGTRIFEVIKLAGGLKKNADLSSINRAEKLSDGEKIFVPFLLDSNASNSFSTQSNNQSNKKVNINLAGIDELKTLDGVGDKTAEKIIKYRETNGRFKTIEEIKNVDRIGEKTFLKLKDYICV